MPAPSPLGSTLSSLLMIAWLLPLCGFAVEIFGGYWGSRKSKAAAYVAVACIAIAFVCSLSALVTWGSATGWSALGHHPAPGAADAGASHAGSAVNGPFSDTLYTLARFGNLRVAIDYYIDSLTLVMFTMVTFIATCIHLFAMGYMSDELTEQYEDHQVHVRHGHFHRPGRFYRFFAFLSLFCFSMLGLVIAGNIFMVFVFWELVGVCSYFLIGFYIERKSASTAANKAFIMNRVGDFGFLIGLMILWTHFGTFQFTSRVERDGTQTAGLFQMLRDDHGHLTLTESGRNVVLSSGFETHGGAGHDAHAHPGQEGAAGHADHDHDGPGQADNHAAAEAEGHVLATEARTIPYFLLIAAGLGIFAGCVGKSAQFPLQTWLPDAMEGPTPVSALVHSATMVAAGVYLVGRFYPMFTPEVLLTIAYVGCVTAFMAATIAVVATDIKKVLAYSTISQLGYMMLGLGVGGWGAGLFHLVTHAFFKSLMFLASGSVIHGCHHVQEMPQMGGLRKKMPITAIAMLVGVIAIAGLAIPGTPIAFSGYHSKDAVVASALTFSELNPAHFLLFYIPLAGAGITAFYMFRLWFYTFAGEPRDAHVYEHAHESPAVMTGPLIVLSLLAAFCAVGGEHGPLFGLLSASEPATIPHELVAAAPSGLTLPTHGAIADRHTRAGMYALVIASLGAFLAWVFYGARWVSPADVQRQFSGLHRFLVEKWRFDELYDTLFMRPVHVVAAFVAGIDKRVFDGLLHWLAGATVAVSRWDRLFDEQVIDGAVNWTAKAVYTGGASLRGLQTGRLRQYVMFIVLGIVGLWVLAQMLIS
ncbi:MAG: proton-conducting transporter membrane subunit [Planctomycetaceae bacterium]